MSSLARAVAAVASAALLWGCHRVPVVGPAPPELLAAADASAALVRFLQETRTLTALFRVTARRADGRLETSRGALAVARPDRLRLQIFSFGVMTVYDYTVHGERFRVSLPLAGETRTGRFADLSPGERKLLRYDLRPLFLGHQGLSGAQVRDTPDAFVLRLDEDGSVREIEVAKQGGWIRGERLLSGRRLELRAGYSDYRPVDGVPLPFRISVEYPAEDLALEIQISSYSRNRPLDEGIFELRRR